MEEDAHCRSDIEPDNFQKAISGGAAYNGQLSELPGDGTRPEGDILRAGGSRRRRRLRRALPIWKATNGLDGYVSWEIDPNLADDRGSS